MMDDETARLATSVGNDILMQLMESGLDPSEVVALLTRLAQHVLSECAAPGEEADIRNLIASEVIKGDGSSTQ